MRKIVLVLALFFSFLIFSSLSFSETADNKTSKELNESIDMLCKEIRKERPSPSCEEDFKKLQIDFNNKLKNDSLLIQKNKLDLLDQNNVPHVIVYKCPDALGYVEFRIDMFRQRIMATEYTNSTEKSVRKFYKFEMPKNFDEVYFALYKKSSEFNNKSHISLTSFKIKSNEVKNYREFNISDEDIFLNEKQEKKLIKSSNKGRALSCSYRTYQLNKK